ncbi:MAG: hypothetical protein CM15mP74_21000 [Halieaceae bacterium]|nr:MAG: hypothetical protein CM15mP74_21000 [Halieaceae bacterium]
MRHRAQGPSHLLEMVVVLAIIGVMVSLHCRPGGQHSSAGFQMTLALHWSGSTCTSTDGEAEMVICRHPLTLLPQRPDNPRCHASGNGYR